MQITLPEQLKFLSESKKKLDGNHKLLPKKIKK